MQLGPLYLTPRWALHFGFDDNVFNSTEAPQSDWTAIFAPAITVALPVTHRALFRVNAGGDMVWFSHFVNERSIDPRLEARAEGYLQRATVSFQHTVLSSRQRPNYDIDVRSRRFESSSVGSVAVAFSVKTSVDVSAAHTTTEYDASDFDQIDLRQALNGTADSIALTPKLRLTEFTSVGLRAERLMERFTYDEARDRDSVMLMPGIELKPRALVSGQAYIGYRWMTAKDPMRMPDFSGIVAHLGLSLRAGQATRINTGYDRDIVGASSAAEPYFVDNSVRLSLTHAIPHGIDFVLQAERHPYDFTEFYGVPVGPVAPPPVVPPRRDRTLVFGAGVGYRMGHNLRIGVRAARTERQSNRDKDFRDLFVSTDVAYGL